MDFYAHLKLAKMAKYHDFVKLKNDCTLRYSTWLYVLDFFNHNIFLNTQI